ncbi:hypothetical protein DFH09DRAFT_1101050 [Mycena vulgaris]|nr:hypothetical protein DFH09DRAFT_1101050 [Mycena vulgaris]
MDDGSSMDSPSQALKSLLGKLDFVITIVDIDARRGTSARQRRVSARQYRVSAASMHGSAAATQPPGKVPRQSAAHDLTPSTSLLWPVFVLIQGWLAPVDYVDRYLMDHTGVEPQPAPFDEWHSL